MTSPRLSTATFIPWLLASVLAFAQALAFHGPFTPWEFAICATIMLCFLALHEHIVHSSACLLIKLTGQTPPYSSGVLRFLTTICTTAFLFHTADKLPGLLSPIIHLLFSIELSKEGSRILMGMLVSFFQGGAPHKDLAVRVAITTTVLSLLPIYIGVLTNLAAVVMLLVLRWI